MNKKTIAMIVISLVVIVFAIIAASKNNTELIPEGVESVISGNTETSEIGTTNQTTTTKPVVTKPTTTTTATTAPTAKTFTIAQVATHNSEANCYSAINGNVYDLTAFITKHPGGDRNILRICGIDGSAAFDGQHGGDSKPERILAGFEIGTLVK